MFGMHLGRAREKIIAVADIGSGSAALAIVAVPKDGPARILAAERLFLPLEERSSDAIQAAIGRHLIEVGQKVLAAHLKASGVQPQLVYALIRAPWTQSKTVEAQTSFVEPTRITDKMVGALAQQALASEKEFDTGQLLEASVIRLLINGYPTRHPEGAQGQRLSIAALLSECEPNFRSVITSALEQLFGARRPVLRSGVHAILSLLRNRASTSRRDFLVVDMASEGTNLIVIRDGITTQHDRIAEGKNALLKRVGSGLPEETLTLLRLIARGECHDPACEAVNSAIAKAEPELVRTFGEVMAKLIVQQRLPNNLILATHDDLVPWLSSFFSRIDFAQFTTTTQPFSVTALKAVDIAHLALPDSGVHADTGLLLASALVNIEERRV